MLWCNAVTVDPTNRLMCCRRSVETGEPFTGVLENRRKPGGQGVQFACGGGGGVTRLACRVLTTQLCIVNSLTGKQAITHVYMRA